MDKKNELLIRVYVVFGSFLILSTIILGRVIKISLFEGEYWRQKGEVNVEWRSVEADRGNIYDVNENLLATSLPFFDIKLDLQQAAPKIFNSHVDSLSYYLSKMPQTNRSKSEWKRILTNERKAKNPGSRYFEIVNDVDYNQLLEIKKFPLFRFGRYKGGIIINRKSKRAKPFKELASRTIGLNRENSDKIGLEGSFDKFLSGDVTKQLMRRIPPGKQWIPISEPANLNVNKGNDVITTLDMGLQDIVHDELEKGLRLSEATGGVAILMEVNTGAIRAISSLSTNGQGNYKEVYNSAVGRRNEPGSTLKLASTLAVLDAGCGDLNSEYEVNGGKKKFYGIPMHDSDYYDEKEMTLANIFKKSSNVGIATAALKCFKGREGQKRFRQHLVDYGLDTIVGIEILGEKKPILKSVSEWSAISVPWLAHGYGMEMTPLQILAFYNAIANDGKRMKPYLVSKIKEGNEIKHQFGPKVEKEQIASPEAIRKMKLLLEGVFKNGTAKKLQIEGLSMAGKTGTTRLNYADLEAENKEYNASFAGYFPADKPKYSLFVVVYKPKKQYYGSSVAGPVFKNIAFRSCTQDLTIAQHYAANVPTEKKENKRVFEGFGPDYKTVMNFLGMTTTSWSSQRWIELEAKEEEVQITKKTIYKGQVPDVRGMGLRDALYVLENLGLDVSVEGLGRVLLQSITPGTKCVGQNIKLTLK